MPQLVFVHGPGAGGCADGFERQLQHFPGSIAPTLPGHLEGAPCPDVARYTDWLRGWLWAQGHKRDLVLVGFTLGACISLQYALDYPDEVAGIVLMTVAIRPKERPPGVYEMRLKAAEGDAEAYREWIEFQEHALTFVEPGLKARLLERHRQVGPLSQYNDLVVIDHFDVRDRIASLRTPLLLVRGVNDPTNPPEYEREIADAVPGARYVRMEQAGHFPMVDNPDAFNRLLEEFLEGLSNK